MVSSTMEQDCLLEIGNVAGEIWRILDEKGPLTLARLAREVEAPRDVVMQAVGWLAREDKIDIQMAPRGRIVALR